MEREKITRQEAFNRMVRGLAAQGWVRSYSDMNNSARCRYRQDMTAGCPVRCAAGHLLRDEDYSPDMDKYAGPLADSVAAMPLIIDSPWGQRWLVRAQQCHDGSHQNGRGANMAANFAEFGAFHGLEWPSDVAKP